MASAIQQFYQQCDPATPLEPGDPRYVHPPEGARGNLDEIGRLTNEVRWSDRPLHLLLAGHRGCGKSTELLRLKQNLESPSEAYRPFFVVYFEADEADIDVNDVDLPDVLLAIIRQVSKKLREDLNIDLRESWLGKFLRGMAEKLSSKVQPETVSLDAQVATFTASIKTSPDERRKIREALEPHVSNLIAATNEILVQAKAELGERGYHDLVLIVDNLDRIVLRDIPGTSSNTHDHLFIHRGAQLAQVNCHALYTLPISMVYSPTATALLNVFGRQPSVLPMAKVVDRKGKDALGMEVLRQIVDKRLLAAKTRRDQAFDSPTTLDYLCRMSSGHLRNLLILLRSASTAAGQLPLTRSVAERAVRGLSTDFERALNSPEFFEVLSDVDETQSLPGSHHDRLLLYNLSILEYLNDTAWYDVNPAIRLLDKFGPVRRKRLASKAKRNR